MKTKEIPIETPDREGFYHNPAYAESLIREMRVKFAEWCKRRGLPECEWGFKDRITADVEEARNKQT